MADEVVPGTDNEPFDMSGFMSAFEGVVEETPQESPAPKPKAPEPAEKKVWKHEATGKEFESEVELLKYDSGYNNSKWGERFKEVQAEIAELKRGRGESQPTQQAQQPVDKMAVMKQIWPDLDEETLRDPAMRTVFAGLERTAEIMQASFDSKLKQVAEENSQLKSRLEEFGVRQEFGLDQTAMAEVLEKHPYLKGLGPKDRMAVIADLVQGKKAPETESRKLKDKIPQQRAEDHVEGSAKSSPPDGGDSGFDSFMESFNKKGVKEQESELSRMIQEAQRRGALEDY